nr:MAG: Zn finger protein [uncultured archaeon]BDI55242.1 MAG: Zn finger protein [uncultured archaeon]
MICPICKKEYTPKLVRKTAELIQDEFPNATKEEREQLISSICSTKCWNKIFAVKSSLHEGVK